MPMTEGLWQPRRGFAIPAWMELRGRQTVFVTTALQLSGACHKAVSATQLTQKGQIYFAIASTDQAEYAAPHNLHVQVQFALISS